MRSPRCELAVGVPALAVASSAAATASTPRLHVFHLQLMRTIAVSTGQPSTPTTPGSYRVYAKIPRWWSTPFREWLPWAVPFVGGIAFHEFGVVPTFPASLGCVRQATPVARWTYAFARVGMPAKVIARS